MFELLGSKRRMCGGITRRDWLQIGGLGFLGLSLSDALRLRQTLAAPRTIGTAFGKAKSCILLLPYGSPPQHETFDPKPDAPAKVSRSIAITADAICSNSILKRGAGWTTIARRAISIVTGDWLTHCCLHL